MTVKSILITGCSSGIGLCVAQGLAGRGHWVFATARKTEDVERLQAEGLESLLLDLNDSASIHAAVEEILRRTGGTLDTLFNNGAYGQPGAADDWTRMKPISHFPVRHGFAVFFQKSDRSEQLYAQALRLYRERPDKEWSLTDCVSLIVMRERNMTEALTADEHFQQAGFRALLKLSI